MSYRYLIGSTNDHGDLEVAYRLDSVQEVDCNSVLQSMYAVLEKAGFTPLSRRSLGLGCEARRVYLFRGTEFEMPMDHVDDVDAALGQIEPGEVFVLTSRMSHNSGGSYDFRLLAVPKGSRLSRKSRWYHRDTFDKDVNWMSGMDSNSDCTVDLPVGARIWEKGQWKPVSNLMYQY